MRIGLLASGQWPQIEFSKGFNREAMKVKVLLCVRKGMSAIDKWTDRPFWNKLEDQIIKQRRQKDTQTTSHDGLGNYTKK